MFFRSFFRNNFFKIIYAHQRSKQYFYFKPFLNPKRNIYVLTSTYVAISLFSPSKENIFTYVKNRSYSDIKKLNKKILSETKHQLGWTPLQLAIVQRDKKMVSLLLESGVDVNEIDTYNIFIHRQNYPEIEHKRLTEFSDYLNPHENFCGSNALHYASLMDDKSIVEELLNAGADPCVVNEKGHKPLDYAKSPAIKSLLIEAESDFKGRRLRKERREVPLDQLLSQNIIGQKDAISTVSSALCRMENDWQNDDHPLVMLFLGSSGVGKTELAKKVAKYYSSDTSEGFIRIDMSEFQSKHEVSKLIGSPPGYVGYQEGGRLTSALEKCPNAVVLFDEVEKAHPDVLTTLLQLFDEGRLTDGRGNTISCKRAIFIMTSNVGSDTIGKNSHILRGNNKAEVKLFKDNVMRPILKRNFLRDEFLGRINEMVYFLQFSPDELSQIAEKQLDFWKNKSKKRHGIQLTWSKEVVDHIIQSYDKNYGARSIQYEVERSVVSQLAAAEEQCVIGNGSVVELVLEDTKPIGGESVCKSGYIKLKVINGSNTKVHQVFNNHAVKDY